MINDLKMVNERPMTVYCPTCKEEYQTDFVKFLDIEEDGAGRDLMSFQCHVCNGSYKSYVFKN